MTRVEAEPLATLRHRTSVKWQEFPDDVLPLWVAEMDYPLAEPIVRVLQERIAASDSGYVTRPDEVAAAFEGFAARHWGWTLDPAGIRTTTDVSVALVETLRRVIALGEGVVITTPVYAPFTELVEEAGGVVVDVPLIAPVADDGAWDLDLPGIDAALTAGARAVLISNPHNPLGLIHTAASLAGLADLAAAHGVTVVSDEIHGALVYSGETFTPFLTVSDAAREWGVAITSASKAFNLAGFKCALMVAASPRATAVLDGMPREVQFRTSILGLHASIAAFTHGDDWLDGAVAAIEASDALLASLLSQTLLDIRYRRPRASYLAWLDATALGWGDDPSVRALEVARVALNSGPEFGPAGRGHFRLNLACSPEVLTEAIERLGAAR
jgi:cysteine-S-conjugate beta-lyase